MNIRHIALPALALLVAGAAQAVEFKQVDAAKSSLAFTSKQMGVPVPGTFKKFATQIAFDPSTADIHALAPSFLGPFEHFYPDCFAGDIGVTTHYVVLAHRIDVPADFDVQGIDDQHESLRWWPIAEATASADVHCYTRDYLPLLG